MAILIYHYFKTSFYRTFPLYVDHVGSNNGLSVVLESYFGLDDMRNSSDFKLFIHQSGSLPDMLNLATTAVNVSTFTCSNTGLETFFSPPPPQNG